MDRRRAIPVVLGLAAALFPVAVCAQAGMRVHRVAFLGTMSADAEAMRRVMVSFKEGLAGEGFVEGRNYVIDFVAEPDVAGAKPAALPVELPTRYALTVNQKSAKALGITIAQTVLLRAERVIE
jgi:hypothetical protein